ncbi:hypothetical protein [Amycolatopsis sp. NPDC058986]|uniref:hypothetical protein n=1 Tax=unclassified Amycolatopsis TaxID=2618356 RepID=UPI00366B7B12
MTSQEAAMDLAGLIYQLPVPLQLGLLVILTIGIACTRRLVRALLVLLLLGGVISALGLQLP